MVGSQHSALRWLQPSQTRANDVIIHGVLGVVTGSMWPGRCWPLCWALVVAASSSSGAEDRLPWANLTQLAQLERTAPFSMRVIVLTMNRPESLARLLRSINNTFFEHAADTLEVEIHVDKAHGWLYDDCVKIAHNFTLPRGRGTVTAKIAKVSQECQEV